MKTLKMPTLSKALKDSNAYLDGYIHAIKLLQRIKGQYPSIFNEVITEEDLSKLNVGELQRKK